MKILVIDIETTGFSHSKDFIIEIGAAELNLQTREIRTVFDQRVVEDGFQLENFENSWIFKNSDIGLNFIENAKPLNEVRQSLQNLLDSYNLGFTAYNKRFDEGFLVNRGFKLPKGLKCPMIVSTDILKLKKKQKWQKGYKWPSVQEAYDYFFPNEDYVELHRGADDAMHEAKIVRRLYEFNKFPV